MQAIPQAQVSLSSLLQKHGGQLRPVANYSKLETVAAALPHCLKSVVAASGAVLASWGLVGYQNLNLLVPYKAAKIHSTSMFDIKVVLTEFGQRIFNKPNTSDHKAMAKMFHVQRWEIQHQTATMRLPLTRQYIQNATSAFIPYA